MRSKYQCQKCEHKWEEANPGPTECPKCGHLYVDWLNFQEMKNNNWR